MIRSRVLLTLTMCIAAAVAAAAQSQSPPTQTAPKPPAEAAAPQPETPAARKFTSDAGMMFNIVKPDKAADFEMVMGRVKDALGKSEDPVRKQQALGWHVFKALEPTPDGNVVYIWLLDPAVKGADYGVGNILREELQLEAQDLWAKYTASLARAQSLLNLQQISNAAPAAK